jgi:hypothetical protein
LIDYNKLSREMGASLVYLEKPKTEV